MMGLRRVLDRRPPAEPGFVVELRVFVSACPIALGYRRLRGLCRALAGLGQLLSHDYRQTCWRGHPGIDSHLRLYLPADALTAFREFLTGLRERDGILIVGFEFLDKGDT